jgi:hypothetical protein
MTDFIDEGRFYIPEGKKQCHAILTKIFAINQTWEQESKCAYGIVNCLCHVDGLSGSSASFGKEVLTKEQFFAKQQTEAARQTAEASQQLNQITLGLGIIGSATGILSLILHLRNLKRRK